MSDITKASPPPALARTSAVFPGQTPPSTHSITSSGVYAARLIEGLKRSAESQSATQNHRPRKETRTHPPAQSSPPLQAFSPTKSAKKPTSNSSPQSPAVIAPQSRPAQARQHQAPPTPPSGVPGGAGEIHEVTTATGALTLAAVHASVVALTEMVKSQAAQYSEMHVSMQCMMQSVQMMMNNCAAIMQTMAMVPQQFSLPQFYGQDGIPPLPTLPEHFTPHTMSQSSSQGSPGSVSASSPQRVPQGHAPSQQRDDCHTSSATPTRWSHSDTPHSNSSSTTALRTHASADPATHGSAVSHA
jgi:hypothetical protein